MSRQTMIKLSCRMKSGKVYKNTFEIDKVLSLLKEANDNEIIVSYHEDKLNVNIAKGKKINTTVLEKLRLNKGILLEYFENEKNKNYYKTSILSFKEKNNIRPVDIPLSFSQERLWFLDKLEGSTSYHISSVLRLSGSIDMAILELSFRDVVDRHEILRTVYKEDEGGFVSQEVLDKGNWKFSSSIVESEEVLLSSLISDKINTPYDLSRDHMLRVSVIEISPIEHILVLVMHHIASDGWSLP
ncbi:condensation domain-containing protein, partial [Aquimarina sp. I32.4]|uniref:condensation domain-containing protein n=1 Tax=Aquimarina sp. I32.4 TaxID=2053903 RepID=UPI0011AED02A